MGAPARLPGQSPKKVETAAQAVLALFLMTLSEDPAALSIVSLPDTLSDASEVCLVTAAPDFKLAARDSDIEMEWVGEVAFLAAKPVTEGLLASEADRMC